MKYWIVLFWMLLSGCATVVPSEPSENSPKKACLCYRDERTGEMIRYRILVVGMNGEVVLYKFFDNPSFKEIEGQRVEITYQEYKEKVHLAGKPLCPWDVWDLAPRVPQAIFDLMNRGTNGP